MQPADTAEVAADVPQGEGSCGGLVLGIDLSTQSLSLLCVGVDKGQTIYSHSVVFDELSYGTSNGMVCK
jgi:hypothetical protein